MPLYARQSRRRSAQLFADVFVVIWAVAWWEIARLARRSILAVAAPARQTAATATDISGEFQKVSTEVAKLPGIGDQTRQPFDGAATSFSSIRVAAEQQVANLERLAHLGGWLVFLVPVTGLVALWLPRRLCFVLAARAAQRYLASGVSPDLFALRALDLFALRALVTQPVPVLVGTSADPVGGWREGNATVISKLAEVEFRRIGLRISGFPMSGLPIRPIPPGPVHPGASEADEVS